VKGLEFLKHHPYFIEEKEGGFYFDDGSSSLYSLQLNDINQSPKHPIEFKLFFRNQRPNHRFLHRTPFWFRLLFFQATEVFFETQRVKTIFYKRSFESILLALIAFLPSDEESIHFFEHQFSLGKFIILKEQKRLFQLATDLLKKNNFIYDIVEKETSWIINVEKENGQ
jgi:hypothetical protein